MCNPVAMTQTTLFGSEDQTKQTWVYVASDGVHVKIGTTVNTHRRGGELKLHIICKLPGGQLAEKRLHRQFGDCRQAGNREWFRPQPKLLLWIGAHIDPRDTAAILVYQQLIRNSQKAA